MDNPNLVMMLWMTGTLAVLFLFAWIAALSLLIARKNKAHRLAEECWKLELEKRTLDARMKERELLMNEIYEEVHGDIGQLTNLVRMYLLVIKTQATETSQQQTVEKALAFTDAILDSIQHMSDSMDESSVHDEGLANSIGWLIDQIRSTTKIDVRFETPEMEVQLPRRTELIVYRIAHQAITNVLRHAHATKLNIRIRVNVDAFEMEVSDNGIGFAADQELGHSSGLKNMKLRARILNGDLVVRSDCGVGTIIHFTMPL